MRQTSGIKWTSVKQGNDGRYVRSPQKNVPFRKLGKIAAYLAGIAVLLTVMYAGFRNIVAPILVFYPYRDELSKKPVAYEYRSGDYKKTFPYITHGIRFNIPTEYKVTRSNNAGEVIRAGNDLGIFFMIHDGYTAVRADKLK